VRWRNLEKPPSRYHTSLLIKINSKLGGVNHTLASRAAPGFKADADEEQDPPLFQSPPKSLSWLMDEPCMVMGVDVNHPESGKKDETSAFSGPSVAALVASMDGSLGQYCCHVSTCTAREEPVSNLARGTEALLKAFMHRNGGNMPKRIIIYRDGVADNQFEAVLQREVVAYKNAVESFGYPDDSVQIAVIMCQKRHSTRLVFQQGEDGKYMNPCVGLCVDGRSYTGKAGAEDDDDLGDDSVGSISSPTYNEFYLNSHAAVLGTSKPCKYVLIYDEIGLKV
jgi:eukaryotic translation initiation factor 2C